MTWLLALAAINAVAWLAIAFAARLDHEEDQQIPTGSSVGAGTSDA